VKAFLACALLKKVDGTLFLREMEKETIGKVYRKGEPQTPNGRTVNAIIARAKKVGIPDEMLMELEQLAYRGFIEFLDEYGGGPDSFDELAANHFEAYLVLASKQNENARAQLFEDAGRYLKSKRNMYRDELDEIFEEAVKKM
jgi:hypothetical protein